MSLKKYLTIAKSPRTAFQYVRKYGKNYASSASYTMRKCFHINEYNTLNRRIKKVIPSMSEMKVFTRRTNEEIEALLLDPEFNQVVMAQAEKGMNNELLILNKTRKDMFNHETGHYRWHDDFFEGYTYKMSHFSRARKVNAQKGVDVKIPWETSRMQYLFSLALAYRATKEVKYASKIKHIILDFMECNDMDEGPNWGCSMEAGIRIANIVLAVELIQDADVCDEEFYRRFALCVYAHQKHIFNNLEIINGRASNHFLGDLLGLAASVAACPYLPGYSKVGKYVIDSLHREIRHQVQSDGSDFEGSTSYQRLVGEILGFTVLAAECIGFELLPEERKLLAKMAEFEQSIQMPNGLVPQVGDNDSGRVFQLSEEETRNHTSCVNLLLSIVQREISECSYKDGFACFWSKDIKEYTTLSNEQTIVEYPDFQAARYLGENLYVFFTAGTPERNGMPGHAHNDLLSFIISLDEEFITDPGSGEYTGHTETRNKLRATASHSTILVNSLEQRTMVPDSMFQWYSKITASVRMDEVADTYRLAGEYRNEKANYTHNRIVSIAKNESRVQVDDKITSQISSCTMCLPIFPGVNVEESDGKIYLEGKQYVLVLSGSWKMSVIDGLYSPQYHETVSARYIYCESSQSVNSLALEIKSVK